MQNIFLQNFVPNKNAKTRNHFLFYSTVEPDLIATEMLEFTSN